MSRAKLYLLVLSEHRAKASNSAARIDAYSAEKHIQWGSSLGGAQVV